jgi:hypothetical protein
VRPAPTDRARHLAQARGRWGTRLDAFAAALHAGDPLADELVARHRPGELALERAHLPGSPAAPLLASVPPRPAWLDDLTLRRGGELLHRAGSLSMIALAASSLVQGYASPAANKPLVFSGQLERRAYRRLHETARFVLEVCAPGAMTPPDGAALRTVLQVRLVHAQIRHMIRRSGRWDAARWGEPANQHDMVGTLMMFTVVVVEALERMGLAPGADEAERYYRLWRWIAIVQGIDAALVPADLAEAREVTAMLRATQPPPDDDARALTAALYASPVREARTAVERAAGHLFRHVMIAGAWTLLPDGMARALDAPRTTMRLALAAMRPVNRAWGAFGARRPSRALAVELGRRSWERFIDHGLGGADHRFTLPRALHGRPVAP